MSFIIASYISHKYIEIQIQSWIYYSSTICGKCDSSWHLGFIQCFSSKDAYKAK